MMSTLDSVLAQYEKSKQSNSGGSKMSQEERMKKYFAAILGKNESTATKRIRILPSKDGSSPFVEAFFHEIQIAGQWNKVYDPGKNDNEQSPLTEVHDELLKTGKESDKELAKSYKSRKFYIVKVIDRDHPEDGVKFWRFKHNYKNEGVLDKIIPIWKTKGDITDPTKGRDLIIELAKAKTPKGKEYTVIQTVMYDDPSPVHERKETADSWINDELTWRDVYSKKPIEYLEAVARGETPRWDTESGKYVYGDNTSSETTIGGSKQNTYSDPQADFDPDSDLPF
jgi:gp32 DNA binding protein like